MNAIELLTEMGEMGVIYPKKYIQDIIGYVTLMLQDERVITISDNGKPIAFIFYSITDDYKPYLLKDEYEYLEHEKAGKTVYVEKLVSFHWNKDLRILFERLITSKYPQLETGIWFRASRHGDRKVIAKRRLQNV